MEKITCCPKCGCEIIAIKENYRGTANFYYNLNDNEECDNSGYYDDTKYTRPNKYVKCAKCGAKIMTIEEFEKMTK
ncbi:MAG: hypothetical protein LKJ25_06055 [Clostridia bacterium]|nr:hypothetical protein [Clostridia bacterium]